MSPFYTHKEIRHICVISESVSCKGPVVYVSTLCLAALKIVRPVHRQDLTAQYGCFPPVSLDWMALCNLVVCFNYVYNFHFNQQTFEGKKKERKINEVYRICGLIWCCISTEFYQTQQRFDLLDYSYYIWKIKELKVCEIQCSLSKATLDVAFQ